MSRFGLSIEAITFPTQVNNANAEYLISTFGYLDLNTDILYLLHVKKIYVNMSKNQHVKIIRHFHFSYTMYHHTEFDIVYNMPL